jgi:hypothetical protein
MEQRQPVRGEPSRGVAMCRELQTLKNLGLRTQKHIHVVDHEEQCTSGTREDTTHHLLVVVGSIQFPFFWCLEISHAVVI